MKKYILILFAISLVSLASAIYPGNCDNFEFEKEGIVTWSVQGNTSSMDGFSFTQNGTKVEYCFSGDFAPDSFILTFYNTIEGEEVELHHSSSRGFSCKYDKEFDWNCSEWSECVDDIQTRICEKHNNCGSSYGKPNEKQYCSSWAEYYYNEGNGIEYDIQEPIDEPVPEDNGNKRIFMLIFITLAIIFIIILIKLKGGLK